MAVMAVQKSPQEERWEKEQAEARRAMTRASLSSSLVKTYGKNLGEALTEYLLDADEETVEIAFATTIASVLQEGKFSDKVLAIRALLQAVRSSSEEERPDPSGPY
jgi:hypothetical protein